MRVDFDTSSVDDYERFLRLKLVPTYQWHGTTAVIPDEYSHLLNGKKTKRRKEAIELSPQLYDYQRDISTLAIRKQKFACFVEPGFGKTNIMWEFARHAQKMLELRRKVLVVSPLMVVEQSIEEAGKFYPNLPVEQVSASNLQSWLKSDGSSRIGITNFEAIRDGLDRGGLGALLIDESSMLKSHYGAWGTRLLEMGRGLDWKLALTGTPAPNDRIEYANHAVFCDHFRTINEFLARYFVNRGETQNRWELKPHALHPFYRDLSHWCIFMTNPAVYGWKDNCGTIPPIQVHIERIDLTDEQRKAAQKISGGLFVNNVGGIGSRGKLSQLAKGRHDGEDIATNKPEFIRKLVGSWAGESTIIWCRFNAEQESMERMFPDAASISGDTPHETRMELIRDFKSGRRKQLITKGKILGFGVNLQIATRHVHSGISDSYEDFWQETKRSNRVGSTMSLNVHIPVTELEEPFVANVMKKAHRVQADNEEQEKLFKSLRLEI